MGTSLAARALPSAELSASLMCARLHELGREVDRLVEAGIDSFHVDLMDGHFVPNLALSPDIVRALRPLTSLPIHIHLMVEQPDLYVEPLAEAGADLVFFHVEATRYPLRLASRMAAAELTPGIAVSAPTPLPELPELLGLGHILVMAVEPGFAGQQWIPSTVDRIRHIRGLVGERTRVVVDGHVAVETVPQMRGAGCDTFVCGTSGLFTGQPQDYGRRVEDLRLAISASEERPWRS